MLALTKRQQSIINLFLKTGQLASSAVHQNLAQAGEAVSLVTVKRELSDMADQGLLETKGSGRSTEYSITVLGRLLAEVDINSYMALEPDQRYGLSGYNFDLFKSMPTDIFTDTETTILEAATLEYKKRIRNLSPTIQKKELERLVIELSWKSSKIEGNTYTLLDTEKLILEHQEAPGHDHGEAAMILNHKAAFAFIKNKASKFKKLSKSNIGQLHQILVKDLSIETGFRKNLVGVVGSKYRPLDNIHQITEAVDSLDKAVATLKNKYAKAMLALLGTSYIQPFADGNKRTARLLANAVLMAYSLAPLSYRSVDEKAYRAATLVFYELNSLVAFKKIFIEQYDFAARNYAVK
jgi:Fic family protein